MRQVWEGGGARKRERECAKRERKREPSSESDASAEQRVRSLEELLEPIERLRGELLEERSLVLQEVGGRLEVVELAPGRRFDAADDATGGGGEVLDVHRDRARGV